MQQYLVIENGLFYVPGLFHIQLRLLLLVVLVGIAVWFDWKQRRIPNRLVFPSITFALLYQWLSPFDLGIASASLGLAVGFAMLLPLYALRAMGAGDVKLMAVVGAFVGGPGAAFATVIYTLLCGGVLSVGHAIANGSLQRLIVNLKLMLFGAAVRLGAGTGVAIDAPASVGKVPYAFAIAGGALTHILMSY